VPYIPPLENYGLDNFDEMFVNENIKKDEDEMYNFDNANDNNIYTGKILAVKFRFHL
jgi:hypothetical protein